MSKGHRKKKSFRWMTLLILIAVLLGGIRIGGQFKRLHVLQAQALALEEELSQAQAEYDKKQGTIELLNDDAYIERLARERLGMVKEGETVVMLVNPELEMAAAAPEPGSTPME